ncbi:MULTISPECIES: heme ABC transporter substrate-binding protein IsdE [Coprobacillaceae]|uniref:heme ABC transporter substrate-binding protein IsdE n=1 Tax=Coprobacillaceae TaxID=2810280 RepID=UPI000E4AB5B7|nr:MULTISPECIES: heme ABC transporter substrate-binding protein IsdE [Coprobacillaceae]RHM61288.1 heme ABC transporter substrate-binding protein IsdE [Coprobacillus sp. AF33-1AC]RHS95869.1 heme ABC transporter substrate-binding protein IsdE [Erysipelatoclostridium sp. AM42-17]
MLKKLKNSLLILCLMIVTTGCVNQNQETHSQQVKLVSTSIAISEILVSLNISKDQVVGIPETQSYSIPKRYQKATKIGTAMSPDMEKLSQLKPDLILSPQSLEGDLAKKYKKLKLNSSFVNLNSLSGMYKSIQELGKLLNHEKQAYQLINEYVDYMTAFREKHQDQQSPRVLILMGLPGGSYVVATESSYVGDLVRLAGGTNIYGSGDGQDFINVSVEDMLKQNPDIILRTSHAMPQQVQEYFKQEFQNNGAWSQFEAVKNQKVYDLNHKYFGMSANFNYQKGLESLEDILYEAN